MCKTTEAAATGEKRRVQAGDGEGEAARFEEERRRKKNGPFRPDQADHRIPALRGDTWRQRGSVHFKGDVMALQSDLDDLHTLH